MTNLSHFLENMSLLVGLLGHGAGLFRHDATSITSTAVGIEKYSLYTVCYLSYLDTKKQLVFVVRSFV